MIAGFLVDPHFCQHRGVPLLSSTPPTISGIVLPDVNDAVDEAGKIDEKKEEDGKVEEDKLAIGDMVVNEARLNSDLWIETGLSVCGQLE